MTIVYPLGNRSKWGDFELLYSLRSVQQHLTGYRNIIVIGEKPQFCGHVHCEVPFTWIPFPDQTKDAQDNVRRKLTYAIESKQVDEEFLLMNDDFFVNRLVEHAPFDVSKIPYLRSGVLPGKIEHREANADGSLDVYLESLKLTSAALEAFGLHQLNFELHVPMRMTKTKLREVLCSFDFAMPRGLLLRSLYGNFVGEPHAPGWDAKIDYPIDTTDGVMAAIGKRVFFSVGDAGLTYAMKHYLAQQFSPHSGHFIPPLS